MSHRPLGQESLNSAFAAVSCPPPNRTQRMAAGWALVGLVWGLSAGLLPAQPDPKETIVVLPKDIKWTTWGDAPKDGIEIAMLYGDTNKAGPYAILVKWHPGYMSVPHTYETDRLCVVVSGTWWVNSGKEFAPEKCVPVPAGGFVRRVAHTWHYDGVVKDAKEPVVIAIYGMGPVDLKLVDPSKPGWRKI